MANPWDHLPEAPKNNQQVNPWDDLPMAQQQPTPTGQPGQIPLGSNVLPVLKDIGIGVANPLINATNFAIKYNPLLTGANLMGAGIEPFHIPTFEEEEGIEHSIGRGIGMLGSTLIPFMAAEKAVTSGVPMALSAIGKYAPQAEQALAGLGRSFIGQAAKQSALGAGVGAALSPEGDRESTAMLGAALGPAGAIAGKGLGTLGTALKRYGASENILKPGFLKNISVKHNPDFARDSVEDILHNYASKTTATRKGYNSVFDPADERNLKLSFEELPLFNKASSGFNKSESVGMPKLKDLIRTSDDISIPSKSGDIIEGSASLRDVHHARSRIFSKARDATHRGEHDLARSYNEVGKSLDKDMENFLINNDSKDLLAKYRDVSKFHKTEVEPFHNNNQVKKAIQNSEFSKGKDYVNFDKINFEGKTDSDKILNSLMMGTKKGSTGEGLGFLKKLTGNHDRASETAKNHLFKDAINFEDGTINFKNYIKNFNKLLPNTKSHLYNAEDLTLLNKIGDLIKKNPNILKDGDFKKLTEHLLGGALGTAAGLASGIEHAATYGGALGILGAGPASSALRSGISKTISPTTTEGIIKLFSPERISRTAKAGAALGTASALGFPEEGRKELSRIPSVAKFVLDDYILGKNQ